MAESAATFLSVRSDEDPLTGTNVRRKASAKGESCGAYGKAYNRLWALVDFGTADD